MTTLYGNADLAFIHDAGYGKFARAAAQFLDETASQRGVKLDTIVDLGCGSGILVELMSADGRRVTGIDQSEEMLKIARRRAPSADFLCRSVYECELPRCHVVTAIGEVINYITDDRPSPADTEQLMTRVHEALEPGGLFLFDGALVGRNASVAIHYANDTDWDCISGVEHDPPRKQMRRFVVTFRREGALYRRMEELHTLQLFEPEFLEAAMKKAGFSFERVGRYGDLEFPEGYAAYIAFK